MEELDLSGVDNLLNTDLSCLDSLLDDSNFSELDKLLDINFDE